MTETNIVDAANQREAPSSILPLSTSTSTPGLPLVRWLVLSGNFPSRRKASIAVKAGNIKVNGNICLMIGKTICRADRVEFKNENDDERSLSLPVENDRPRFQSEITSSSHVKFPASATATGGASTEPQHVHIVMNKGSGTLCSRRNKIQLKGGGIRDDPRPTVYDAFSSSSRAQRVQSIGRLDCDTTGLLLFTTDGWLSNVLASPQFKVPKVYVATLRSPDPLSEEAAQQLQTGVVLPHAQKATVRGEVRVLSPAADSGMARVELTISNGYKHQVKLMLSLVQRPLSKLHRKTFANLILPGDLGEGEWRELSECERDGLYRLARSQWAKHNDSKQ